MLDTVIKDNKARNCIIVFLVCIAVCAYAYYKRGVGGVKSSVLDKRWYYNTVIYDFDDQIHNFKQDLNDGVLLAGEVIIHPNQQLTMTSDFTIAPPISSDPINLSLVSRSLWELSGEHFLTQVQDIVIKSRGNNPAILSDEELDHLKQMHSFSLGLTREIVSVSDNFLIMSGGLGLTVFYADD